MGRHLSADGIYARQLGISVRQVKRLGGAAKLSKLSPECRRILLKPCAVPDSIGLAARGMTVQAPTQRLYKSQTEWTINRLDVAKMIVRAA